MAIKPGTMQEVQRIFEEAFNSITNCQKTQDLKEYERLFHSVIDPVWEQVSETVEKITVHPNISIFRVVCQVTLDDHGNGIGGATVNMMRGVKVSLAAITEAAESVVVCIQPPCEKDVPFGKRITLIARGIIEKQQ